MTYQPALPGLTPPQAGRRREPRQRKGETWESYAMRYETWRHATFRKLSQEEREERMRINSEWRERIMRSTEIWCYRLIERAKRTPSPPWAVFFWFGGDHPMEFRPGTCGYVSQVTLDYLVGAGVFDPDRRPRARRGENRVSFGPCGL
jgi:hypothetical protein